MTTGPDITFHYPPELFNLLVDTIPLLNRGKKGVLVFFRGAGVGTDVLADLGERVASAPNDISKYEIVRTVLERLNARGEPALRERREVLRRVVEFTNFDTCWPDDQLPAKGLVAGIRDVVNQKDTFTRINQAREQEREARLAEVEAAARAKRARLEAIDAAKDEFYRLFAPGLTPSARGKLLETALNNLFKAYGILVQEAFHLVGPTGEEIVEQIDGIVELKGIFHFVEMKWHRENVGRADISEHLVRLMSRAEARGVFISASEYTEPAISTAREFLQHKTVVLSTLHEIVRLLEQQGDLAELFLEKIKAAQIHKNPYHKPFDGS